MNFFSLLPFLILGIKRKVFNIESLYHKDSTASHPLNKVTSKPCSAGFLLGWVTKYPVLYIITSVFLLFFPSLFKAVLKAAELPPLCYVFSSIYQLFVHHFAVSILCVLIYNTIHVHCRNTGGPDVEYD